MLQSLAFAATDRSSCIPNVLMQTFSEYAGGQLHHKFGLMVLSTCSLQLAMHSAFV